MADGKTILLRTIPCPSFSPVMLMNTSDASRTKILALRSSNEPRPRVHQQLTGEKEGQGMVRSKIVFRQHWAMPPLIVLFNGNLLSRFKSDNHRHDLGEILVSLGFWNRRITREPDFCE